MSTTSIAPHKNTTILELNRTKSNFFSRSMMKLTMKMEMINTIYTNIFHFSSILCCASLYSVHSYFVLFCVMFFSLLLLRYHCGITFTAFIPKCAKYFKRFMSQKKFIASALIIWNLNLLTPFKCRNVHCMNINFIRRAEKKEVENC